MPVVAAERSEKPGLPDFGTSRSRQRKPGPVCHSAARACGGSRLGKALKSKADMVVSLSLAKLPQKRMCPHIDQQEHGRQLELAGLISQSKCQWSTQFCRGNPAALKTVIVPAT